MTGATARPTPAHRPLVGLSARRWPAALLGSALPPAYSDAGVDLGIADYPAAIAAAGGLPVHLAPDAPAHALVERLDALVLTGGADVDPTTHGWAGADGRRPEGLSALGGHAGQGEGRGGLDGPGAGGDAPVAPATEPERDRFELELLRAALDLDVPVLAVCRGLQLLNVALGGTLVADLPAGAGDDHPRFSGGRHERVHPVTLAPGSLAASVYGTAVVVNSLHHQAVARLGEGLVAVGSSPDGTIEALELPGRSVLALQWHPESLPGDPGPAWVVAAGAERALRNRGDARWAR